MSSPLLLALAYALFSAFITHLFFSRCWKLGQRETFLPPGPPTIPLLGNIHVLPKKDTHHRFTEWAMKYGNIYSLKLASNTTVILTGRKEIREILEKNSILTSDRPYVHLPNLTTGGRNMAFTCYTDIWRSQRRATREILSPQSCLTLLPIQKAEAAQLLFEMLVWPENFIEHTRRYSFSVILSVVFGKRAPRYSTPNAQACFEMLHHWEQVLAPGAHPPVDMVPILKKVPEMFAYWKRLCNKTRSLQQNLYYGLLDEVESRIMQGTENKCFMETLSSRKVEWGLDREYVSYLGGALLEAGTDTTAAFMQSLILLLVAHPDVQRKAQAEIDAVVGSDAMPVIDDLSSLPYVQAVIYETHRYRPVVPLSIPHSTTANITYENYVIPEGTTLFHNIWGVFHDAETFIEPEKYNPDRFMTDSESAKIINTHIFGSGRRICPGLHMAKNSIAINTMGFIWGFRFEKALNEKGHEIDVDVCDYAQGLDSIPNPFRCTVTARSPFYEATIRREFQAAKEVFLPFEHGLCADDIEYLQELRNKFDD